MTFHQYDPYQELENTKLLVQKLIEVNNHTQVVIVNLQQQLEENSKEIRQLRRKINSVITEK
jgi:hypothetical protein